MILLVASYIFYMYWRVEYALLLVASTVIDYTAGRFLDRFSYRRIRMFCLLTSLSANLGLLFLFKYFNFAAGAAAEIAALIGWNMPVHHLAVILPVGISFYTFQTMGYTIDVYRGRLAAEKHPGYFALYVSFFPQLVAGPIERASNLLPQFRRQPAFDADRIRSGARLMLWGFFKKMVIADNLAVIVNMVYARPAEFDGLCLLVATLAFSWQIFCDFSGYTDIAIGAARILGYDLMENFRRPYWATSIPEFWQRWHISLSTWFRDYVYLPLGGNRVGPTRRLANILVVFILSGIWHGANWTFLVWGLLHAVFYLWHRFGPGFRSSINEIPSPAARVATRLARTFFTFTIVTVAWIFFRAESIPEALHILTHLFSGSVQWLDGAYLIAQARAMGITARLLVLTASGVVILEAMHAAEEFNSTGKTVFDRMPTIARWAFYLFLTLLIMNGAHVDEISFIYFQF
jgi:D-alanyl-lipoteichoic acid acyltransferase DltB (MBOAT superfamily)